MGNRAKQQNPYVGVRIRELRLKREMTQAELAAIVNKCDSTVRMWELGKSEPDNETLKKIADFFDVSVDYLLERVPSNSTQNKKSPAIEGEVEFNDIYKIPLLGRVVAGVPLEAEENLEGYVYISFKPKEDYFALRVRGDSMINAGIFDKSILIVHKQETAECGDIVVAMIDGETTVKRFKRYSSGCFLMPENPAYDPILIPQGADFLILGKVVEVRMAL